MGYVSFTVTHVGPSDSVDLGEHPGAIDADVRLTCGWSVSVTLLPAHPGDRDPEQWVAWGYPDNWLSDPAEVAEGERDALVTAVNKAARAAGLSVEGRTP